MSKSSRKIATQTNMHPIDQLKSQIADMSDLQKAQILHTFIGMIGHAAESDRSMVVFASFWATAKLIAATASHCDAIID